MRKHICVVALCIMAVLVFALLHTTKLVEFQPIKLEHGTRDRLVSAPELLTPEYLNRIKEVLAFYGEPYEINAAGRLLVTSKLARDKELLWNYSSKALDDAFLSAARNRSEKKNSED